MISVIISLYSSLDIDSSSYLEIIKDGDDVSGANIGLDITANVGNNKYENQQIYYTIKDFGNGNKAEVDSFLEGILGD